MIFAGIDAGSRAIKIVLFDSDKKRVIGHSICDQSAKQAKAAKDLFAKLLKKHRLRRSDIAGVVATGYGRSAINFASDAVTEITCHAKGVRYFVPDAATVIDIGGQDSKVIKIDKAGLVYDFAMNDRCAAGTGRFLEVVAQRLGVGLGDYGLLAKKSTKPAQISSMCVVFAETEIISLLASGKKESDIAAGIQHAIISRVVSMAGGGMAGPIIFTGGVALVGGMKAALEKTLSSRVQVCEMAQYTGAVGAALLAVEKRKS